MAKTPITAPRGDLEYYKFGKDSQNEIYVRTKLTDSTVSSTPSGLKGRRTRVVTVGDTPTQLDSGLSRESIIAINEGANAMRVGDGTVTFTGPTRGYPVGIDEGFNEDTTETAPLYGVCDTGKTTEVTVMEYIS